MKLFDTNLVSRFLHRNTPSQNPQLYSVVRTIIADEGLTVTWFTVFEIRRGLEELRQRGEGRRKLVDFEKVMASADVLGLDGGGWELAARLWGAARVEQPGAKISDVDFLIAATAAFHHPTLVTSDARLGSLLSAAKIPVQVVVLPLE